jgi:hypothetical protein
MKRRWLTLKTKPKRSILKQVNLKKFESLKRLVDEKKRIVLHPSFFDGTWSTEPKIAFHESVDFRKYLFEDSL